MPDFLGLKEESVDGDFTIVKKGNIPFMSKKFSRTYYVLADNTSQTETTIVATSGIPAYGDLVQGAKCISAHAEETYVTKYQGIARSLWEVTCKFDNNIDIEDYDDPTNRDAEIEWDGEFQEIGIVRDVRDSTKPITTSAGEQVYASAELPISILTISRYETWPFPPMTNLLYSGRVNSETFYGAPIGCALMLPIRARREHIDNVNYAYVTYRIKFKMIEDDDGNFIEDGWNLSILNNGYLYLPEGETDKAKAIKHILNGEDGGNGHPTKVNLDKNGHILGENDDPTFSEYWANLEIDFNNLNLGP